MKLLKIFEKKKIENTDIIVVKPIISDDKKAFLYDAEKNKYYRPYKFQIIDKADKNIDDFINKLRETTFNQADYIIELERKIEILKSKNNELSEDINSLKNTIEQFKNYNKNAIFDLNQTIQKKNKQIDSLTETIEFKDNIIEKQNNHLLRISHKNDNKNHLINILLESNINKKSLIKNQNEIINNIKNKLNNKIAISELENNKSSEIQKNIIKKLEEQIEKDKIKRNITLNEKDNQIKILTENLNITKKKIEDIIKDAAQNKIKKEYKLNLNEINIETLINLCKEDFKNLKVELNDRVTFLKTKITDYEYFGRKLNEYITKYQINTSDLTKAIEILLNINNNQKNTTNTDFNEINNTNHNYKTRQFHKQTLNIQEILITINNIETIILNLKDKNESEIFATNLLNQTIKYEESKFILKDFFNHINHELSNLKRLNH